MMRDSDHVTRQSSSNNSERASLGKQKLSQSAFHKKMEGKNRRGLQTNPNGRPKTWNPRHFREDSKICEKQTFIAKENSDQKNEGFRMFLFDRLWLGEFPTPHSGDPPRPLAAGAIGRFHSIATS
ncbi:MAG: hypothetical protein ACLFN9_07065 [Desulfococcaceae bacterium]